MAKVNKNQRTDRLKNSQANKMAKIVVSEKKANGQFRYRAKMVLLENLQDELKNAGQAL